MGRGGAGFPTYLKWEAVNKEKADKKYIVCNGSEGEPNVFKDGFILENYPEKLIQGIEIALETIGNSSAYIYLKKDYYKKFKKLLEKLIGNLPITLFEKTGGYIAGEETAVLESIEGRRPEPRIKPPFPTESGLWGYPTLINNIETFYSVAKIADNEYKNTRFYSIGGDVKNKGVYELSENLTIKEILEKTHNYPLFDFFVQKGGGASGEILLSNELDQMVKGVGAIIIFNKAKTDLFVLMETWADFFMKGNCDKCVPCREGLFRIAEMIKKKEIDEKVMEEIFFVLEKTSFCALGRGAVVPFRSLINKLMS